MKASACLVRQTPASWIVSIGEMPPLVLNAEETKPAELAQAVLEYADRAKPEYGRCHSRIVLCPEPRATLFATSPLPKSIKKNDRQQLKFHAESLLPLDAEQMAADFAITPQALRVMAIDREEWQPIIDAFLTRDLHFRWIAPAAVLAMEEARPSIGETVRVAIWEENGLCELFHLDASGLVHWTHLTGPDSDRMLPLRLFATQAAGCRTWVAINCSELTLDTLNQLDGIEIRPIAIESQIAFASRAADRLCRGPEEAWFDLRDGTIAGSDRYRSLYGWLQIAAASLVGLSLLTSAVCWWKSRRFEQQLSIVQEQHEKLYRQSFPNEKNPPNTLSGMERSIASLRRKLQGETNGSGDLVPIPSALDVLYAALSSLRGEEGERIIVSSLKIQKGELDASLSFESETDAIALAERMKKVGIDLLTYTSSRDSSGRYTAPFKGKLRDGKTVPGSKNQSGPIGASLFWHLAPAAVDAKRIAHAEPF